MRFSRDTIFEEVRRLNIIVLCATRCGQENLEVAWGMCYMYLHDVWILFHHV